MKKIFLAILLLFTLITARTPATDSARFYFVQITDTHWGDGNHLELTKKAVQMIKSLPMKIEFIAHTGDLAARADSAAMDSGLAILKSADIPLHFVAGNHDLNPNSPLTIGAFKRKTNPFLSEARYHGVNVVFFCTEPLAANYSIPEYSPLQQLNAVLEKRKGEPCLLFVHSAPCIDFYNNSFHDTWASDNKKNIEEVINKHSPKAILAGHFHRSDFFWIGNTPVYICPSVAGYFGRESSFRIYQYDKGKLHIFSQYIH